ncbi:MAG: response regulator [Myxococcota bacterium]
MSAATSRLLVVDEDQTGGTALAALLREEGYRVWTADDPQRAIDAVREFAPDLVLAAVRVTRGVGVDFLHWLHTHRPDIQLLLLVVSTSTSGVQRLQQLLGASDHLRKPIDVGDAVARVEAALSNSSIAADVTSSHG